MLSLIERIALTLNEETTTSNIAFIPGGGVTTIRKNIANLLKLKSDWNIQVLDEGENYGISFEDVFKVVVPKLYYKEFNETVFKVDGLKTVNISTLLEEAISSDFDDLISVVSTELSNIPEIDKNIVLIRSFISIFPNAKRKSPSDKYLIDLLNYQQGITKLLQEIKNKFSNDSGYLERLRSTIEDRRPLSALKIFRDFSFLAGVDLEAEYEGITIKLITRTNMALQNSQLILVSDEEFVQEMRYYKDVKVIKNTIQPIGEITPSILMNLKSTLKGRKYE